MAIACFDVPNTYTTNADNYFIPPVDKTWAITAMFCTNRDVVYTSVALDLWIINSDDQTLASISNAAPPNNKFIYIKALGIPSTDTYINDVQRLILTDNNIFYWKAAIASSINIVISYMEI
jgi:hypothetical protein